MSLKAGGSVPRGSPALSPVKNTDETKSLQVTSHPAVGSWALLSGSSQQASPFHHSPKQASHLVISDSVVGEQGL